MTHSRSILVSTNSSLRGWGAVLLQRGLLCVLWRILNGLVWVKGWAWGWTGSALSQIVQRPSSKTFSHSRLMKPGLVDPGTLSPECRRSGSKAGQASQSSKRSRAPLTCQETQRPELGRAPWQCLPGDWRLSSGWGGTDWFFRSLTWSWRWCSLQLLATNAAGHREPDCTYHLRCDLRFKTIDLKYVSDRRLCKCLDLIFIQALIPPVTVICGHPCSVFQGCCSLSKGKRWLDLGSCGHWSREADEESCLWVTLKALREPGSPAASGHL